VYEVPEALFFPGFFRESEKKLCPCWAHHAPVKRRVFCCPKPVIALLLKFRTKMNLTSMGYYLIGEKMASEAKLQLIFNELKALRKDVNEMRLAVIPEENISAKERKEIRQILREMQAGKEKTFDEVFG
jgi:hypothetical protein